MTNFFISYNKADKTWAEWIAWQLEEAGFTTILQAWDFRPAHNFPIKIDQAIKDSERIIAVLSQSYLDASFTKPEWASAFRQDPTGSLGVLLPVRVQECDLKGLLDQIIYIDLVGKDEPQAKAELLAGIQQGRAKPLTKPEFPGDVTRSVLEYPSFPGRSSRKIPKTLLVFALAILGASLSLIWASDFRRWWQVPPRPCLKTASGEYHEAEKADLIGEASKDTEHSGYSGDGYVSGFGHGISGTAATFWVEAPKDGQYQVELCYANATESTKTLTLFLNDERVTQTRLPNDETWNMWLTQTEVLTLHAGRNAISYRKTPNDKGEVNLDFIRVARLP
jgi:hypothetical protein